MIKLDLQKHTDPINYLATDTELTAVADAIREKGGTSAALEFPSGFVSAIGDISTGASAEPLTVTQNGTYTAPTGKAYTPVTVNVPGEEVEIIDTVDEHGGTIRTINTGVSAIFIDYDGTEICRKTKAEINAMSSDSDLPANPSHTGLTAQGWNWTVAQLKAQFTAMPDQNVYVGQMYTTVSGATEIDVEMEEGRLNPTLTICPNGTISVDWGDNTTPDSVTGTNVSTRKAVSHTYASAGSYTIKISLTSGTKYGFYCSQSYTLLRKNTTSNENLVYSNVIKKIRLGLGAYTNSNAFNYCYSLKSITIPNTVTTIDSSTFQYCYSLSSVTIPSGITTFGTSAFSNCYSLKNVSIPSTVTSIKSNTFYNCYNLSSVTIPNGVTSIAGSTFYACYSLKSITIPSTVTSIDTYAFFYCYALTRLTIPSSVTSIGTYAFGYCGSLKSITIPSSVTSIGNSVFNYCYSLKSITIPSGVTSIGSTLCQYCYSLKSITIPSTVTSIGKSAFQYCYSLPSVTIPSTVTSIGKNTFYNCFSLKSVTIPNTVTSIGDGAFISCYSLSSVTIPSSVTSIDANAFGYCYSLSRLTIPSSVTSIGNNAFQYCYGMKEYHFEATTPPTLGTTAFNVIVSDCIIYVPYSADHSVLAAYQTETNWSTYASKMQEEPA